MAISTLGIEGAGTENLRRAGPRDIARLAELDELDKQIADPTRYQGARYQLIEDCLNSAILARGLERPRNEVESRFAQTDQLAQQLDVRHQRMRIAYNRAWTAYWWYEDYPAFNRFYDEVEQHLVGSTQAAEVERLLTLWQVLLPSVVASRISAQDAKVEARQEHLVTMLRAIADDPARPNNALQARTGLALMEISRAYQGRGVDSLDACWAELSKIVDESTVLGAYPVERLSTLVHEIGEYIDSPTFDALYEKVVDVVRHRRSEGEAGEAYKDRGIQKLEQGKPYEAIRWFGRAEELLVKEEYGAELVKVLAASSYAYERVGLLWAARNKVLVAVERSLSVLVDKGKIISAALLSLQRLTWIELQLGRLPHVLSAMTLANFAALHLKLSEDAKVAYREEMEMQEAVLGIHLLNIPFEALPATTRLPDALERLGLTNARLALLFALGQEKAIYDEEYFTTDEDAAKLHLIFERWQDQPAAKDIPPHPVLVDGQTTRLRSTILGSELVVETPNDPTSFGIAESLLGALEAFLATSDEGDLMPHRERTVIVISASKQLVGLPEIRFSDDRSVHVEIIHPIELAFPTAETARKFLEWIQESVITLLSRLFAIRDPQSWMNKVAGEERAFSRALILGNSLTLDRNVFGDEPRLRLADWLEPEDKIYDLLRTQPWRSVKATAAASSDEPPRFGSGPPPPELLDKAGLKHTDRRILSPIDVLLWDRAKWRGTAFGLAEGAPPFLGIAFEDGEAGQAIFQQWRERWGKDDAEDMLRIAIITGISARNPTHYAVTIGPNLSQLKASEAKIFLSVSRIHRMEATSSANLDLFLDAYRQIGRYFLVPAQMGSPPTFLHPHFLAKRQLQIRQAWEIGENDPDVSALRPDDDPIIPPMIQDPPVKKALEQMSAFRQRSRSGQ